MLSFRTCISVVQSHSRSLRPYTGIPVSLLSSSLPIPSLVYPSQISCRKASSTNGTKTKTKTTSKVIPNKYTKQKPDIETTKNNIQTNHEKSTKPKLKTKKTPQQENKNETTMFPPVSPPQTTPTTSTQPTSSTQSTNPSPSPNLRVQHAAAPDVYPIVALVGRPNVGKSTLFNRFALGDKRALVGDVAGTTRDRDYAACRWYGRDLIVVDTGGIVGEGGDKFPDEAGGDKKPMSLAAMVRAQALIAISEASTVVFVLDIHDGVTQHDLIIARMLRKRGKHIVVVVNKADNQDLREFYFQEHKVEYERLGFGEPIVTSAIHGEGFLEILDRVVEPYPETPEDDKTDKEIRIAIVGQPNAGKSSLLNRITGEERAVVSPVAGTTSDPVDTLITWRGQHRVRLIDTAGIWKRANDALARAAVIWALRVVQRAHVVILVVDGTVGVTEHDKHVAGFILEHMKSVVVAVNKWDIYPKMRKEREEERPRRDKMSHYQWHLHARDLAIKVMTNDKAGIAAWEKGDKKGKKHKHSKEKDTRNKLAKPQEEEKIEENKDEEDKDESGQPPAEVVKMNARQSNDTNKMSELTKELLESEAQQERKSKFKKGKEMTKHADDEIDFDKLEASATEFEISLNAPKPPAPSPEEKALEARKRRHTPTKDESEYEEAARAQLRFLPFVPVTFISATTGYRVPSLMDLAVEVFHERGIHIKTQDMFEVLRTAALRHKLPGKGKNLLRVRYASQVDAYPPTFVFFVNNPDAVKEHYEKFLETCIREKYQFLGTPIRLIFKKNSNKYTKDKSS